MVQPLEEWEIRAREAYQENIVLRRRIFLSFNRLTQEKVVAILEQMSSLVETEDEAGARKYFFHEISTQRQKRDSEINWSQVRRQILWSCFSDSDMEQFTLQPNRINSELTVYRALLDMPRHEGVDF